MRRRIKYLLFIVCIILLALLAPVFLFSLKDQIDNQTLYAENQDITVSDILTNNYIEDDAERYTTYLYNLSQGVEYSVMELDSNSENEEDISQLWADAYGYDSPDFEIFSRPVSSVSTTHYAVYNTEDHRDIIFLLTLLTIELDRGFSVEADSGENVSCDLVKLLIDSQTGMLYFMGIYYINSVYAAYDGLFSYSPEIASSVYSAMMYDTIFDMTYYSYIDILANEIYYFADEFTGEISYVEIEDNKDYIDVNGYFDLIAEDGFYTGVELEESNLFVSFPICFAARTSDGDSYVTVELTTQFNTYEQYENSDFRSYRSNVCIGIREFASLLHVFNYQRPSVG